MKPFLQLLGIALAALLAAGCGEDARPPARPKREPRIITTPPELKLMPAEAPATPLLPPFQSLMDETQALAIVEGKYEYALQREQRTEAREHCPGLYRKWIDVIGFEHLGQPGKLTLEFVDGRLQTSRFVPRNFVRYRELSQEELDVPLIYNQRQFIGLATSVLAMRIEPVAVVHDDMRFFLQTRSIERACRYQQQLEDGLVAKALAEAADPS